MRVARILSLAGVASRRHAEELIRAGRVVVNGEVVRTLGTTADPEHDDVRVDGRPAAAAACGRRRYVLLHKPRGYVCTRSDERGRPTVLDLLPAPWRHLYPVGRLDVDSEGLLLLTDDGDFCLRLTHPRYGITKVYEVRTRGVPTADTLSRMERGIRVEGEKLHVERATLQRRAQARPGHRGGRRGAGADRAASPGSSWLLLELREGKKNEIRRLLRALGHPVVRLRRVAIGPLTLRSLPLGQHRILGEAEVHRLLAAAATSPRPPRAATPVPSRRNTSTGDQHAQAHHG